MQPSVAGCAQRDEVQIRVIAHVTAELQVRSDVVDLHLLSAVGTTKILLPRRAENCFTRKVPHTRGAFSTTREAVALPLDVVVGT